MTLRGRPHPAPSSEAASRVMRGNRRTDTRPELRLRSALHREGLRFRKDFQIRARDVRVRADIVFTRKRVAVFVDGCFWHGCPEHGTSPTANRDYWAPKLRANVERDQRITAALQRDGWRVVRIWEHVPLDDAVRQVCASLTNGT